MADQTPPKPVSKNSTAKRKPRKKKREMSVETANAIGLIVILGLILTLYLLIDYYF